MYGTFVRDMRESRGMTQAELAEVSGLKQPNISALEQGRRMPTIETLHRLATSCGYELAAISGDVSLRLPLAEGDWFDELPPRLPDDPPDEPPTVDATTPDHVRNQMLMAILDAMPDRSEG